MVPSDPIQKDMNTNRVRMKKIIWARLRKNDTMIPDDYFCIRKYFKFI